ncbi:hypothetical protein INT48_005183 [Thamnidium elegans]|uniref:Uncharacterized protein n=1 Tax=Thamnidium elegans TaxID=101142 RepID=A0A8H7SNY1_9FUNG|nr:hypothetical protein INT48_005183 [Thamnidium elegans]
METEKGLVNLLGPKLLLSQIFQGGQAQKSCIQQASKCHFNALLKKLVYLPPSHTKEIGLGIIQFLLDDIEEYIKSYSGDTNNKIKSMTGTGMSMRQLNIKTWTSDVECGVDTGAFTE